MITMGVYDLDHTLVMSTDQESQLRKRKQAITTSKQEHDDNVVSESAPPPQVEIKQKKKDGLDTKNWLAGSYWLVRVIFIRCLACIYCKYKSSVIF